MKYNLFTAIDKNDGGTYWHKVGVAFPGRNKPNTFNLQFNSLPLPDSRGVVSVMMFPDEPRPMQMSKHHDNKGDDLDDDLPF